MSKEPDYPYDLYIYRKYRDVPVEDRWKWNWENWDPLIDQIFHGEVKPDELSCPICDQKTIYSCFLIGRLRFLPERNNEKVYVGNIFIGCLNCNIQKRYQGEAPPWAKESDIVWVSEKARKTAEAIFEQEKAKNH